MELFITPHTLKMDVNPGELETEKLKHSKISILDRLPPTHPHLQPSKEEAENSNNSLFISMQLTDNEVLSYGR